MFQSGGVSFKDQSDLISNTSELIQNSFLRPNGMSGIIKAPVVAVHLARKSGASLVGIAADGDDRIDGRVEELIQVLGSVARDVDTDLFHYTDGLRMNEASWF